MTMMALTRKRHRGLHLWLLAAGLLLVGIAEMSVSRSNAYAIAEGDVQLSVVQSPVGGSTVQVGSTVTFDIAPAVTNAPIAIPLYIEFLTPSGLSYVGSNAPGGITCALIPATDDVRCDYGNVVAGPLVQITLSFAISASLSTDATQFRIRAGAADGGPDLASTGDDSYTGAGVLTVFGSSTIFADGSGSPVAVFEGSNTTYTVTLENSSGVATGSFSSSLAFTNGIVTGVTCTTAGPNGSAGGASSSTATCTGSNLADGQILTVAATVVASNTPGGANITATFSASGLGISTALSGVTVDEVGLDFTGSALLAGTAINVCTGAVPTDVTDDAAAGAAQPNNALLLVGPSSLSALLQVADFQVSGPGVGAVSAATGCGANQSGVSFTPSVAGSYSATANYNTGGTNVLSLSVGGANNPVPATTLLTPSTAAAGGAQFVLTVSGSNFVAASVVNWNGVPLATLFGSANSLTATVPATHIASATTANITVTNPAPGGGTSSPAVTFTVTAAPNPLPTASTLAPSTVSAGSSQFTITVGGSNFVASSVVNWNGVALATTFGAVNSLTAVVPAANVSAVTIANVSVSNPAPGGGTSSPALSFTVTAAPNPIPAISLLSPNTISAVSAQFLISVTGTNFVATSVVLWNGVALTTAFGSSTTLTATVPAANVLAPGAANITVFNPSPGGGTSIMPQTFTITVNAAKLAFTTQPGSGVAGSALTAQPVVAVQTSTGATVTGDSTTLVTLSLNGTGTLSCAGGLTKTVAAGVAAFTGCAVSGSGADFTVTAAATGLTSAVSGVFEVTVAPPTASTEVTVSNPSNAPIPRSRLSFRVSSGNLAATAVGLIIKRKADGKYFNVASGEWQSAVVQNPADDDAANAWTIDIAGETRREFAGTIVTLEARVTVGSTIYVNAAIPELTIR